MWEVMRSLFIKLLGRSSKTVDFRETEGGIHNTNIEAPEVAAGEMWEDESFTPTIAMRGTIKELQQSERPIWKRPKASF